MGFDYRVVPDIVAVPVGFHGAVAAGQNADILVSRARGGTAVAGEPEISGQLGDVADDDVVVFVRNLAAGNEQGSRGQDHQYG